tara:strand:- start:1656 stop:2060 length:405 start_codon:yes stop_codon:yes gene_type:complete
MSTITSLVSQLPQELEDYIYELKGGIIHRENYKLVLNKIYPYALYFRFIRITPFEVAETIDMDEIKSWVYNLNQCNCCKKHKKRKPTYNEFLNGYCPAYPTKSIKKQLIHKQCKCPCRHLVRHICREVNDEIIE